MRFDGKLEKWNDDRGFGFITPQRGGEPVFVHISAFPRDGARPRLGEPLTFEVEPAGDGKKRAVNVQRPGHRPAVPARPRGPKERTRETRFPLLGVIALVALVAGGGYAYTRAARVPLASEVAEPRSYASPAVTSFRCDGRRFCSQMTSCEEAKWFLKNCPDTRMDGDRDGIPCEKQWC